MRKYLEWEQKSQLGDTSGGILRREFLPEVLNFSFPFKYKELSLQMTARCIRKLEWNGHLPREMFLTQNDLRNRKIEHSHHHKGTESVVRTSSHETISIFYVLSSDRTNEIEFFHGGDKLVNLCPEDLEMGKCHISLSNTRAVDGV